MKTALSLSIVLMPLLFIILSVGYVIGFVNLVYGVLILVTSKYLFRYIIKNFVTGVERNTIGFFHPFADQSGGGERVLWAAIKALQDHHPNKKLFIYTDPNINKIELCENIKRNFNLEINLEFEITPLRNRDALHGTNYKSFTLIRQALASMVIGYQILKVFTPETFIDTTGWSFIYPMAWMAGSDVICYVHYPMISTDMITRVKNREIMYNNNSHITNSNLKSYLKFMYYNVIAVIYGITGMYPRLVLCNSRWTKKHIDALWWRLKDSNRILYPPVDINNLSSISSEERFEDKKRTIVSIGQFRPEKNHMLQLKAYKEVLSSAVDPINNVCDEIVQHSTLKIIGSCRNEEDVNRLDELKEYCKKNQLNENVSFCVNISFDELKNILSNSIAGLHTMIEEHFGICVVEYMAAGLIPIAHNSGGPKEDIIVNNFEGKLKLGYLAKSIEEYNKAIYEVLTMNKEQLMRISDILKDKSKTFSQDIFINMFAAIFMKE